MLKVCGSISTKTGLAPSRAMHPAVAKNVNDRADHFIAGLMPIAISEQSSASVPLETPMACLVWQ